MNMLPSSDRMQGKTYDLIRLAYGLSCGDGTKSDFMPSGDVGERRNVKVGKEFFCGDGLEGNRDIV